MQGINMVQQQHSSYRSSESPLSNESSAIIEGMTKACRYSPEERKERIERYRSKRNHRNFNKKIKVLVLLLFFFLFTPLLPPLLLLILFHSIFIKENVINHI